MKFTKLSFVFATSLALTACSDDNPWVDSAEEGGIIPSVSADYNVKDAIPTRSQAYAPDAGEFGVRLTKSDGTFTDEWPNVEAFPADKGFRSGQYTLEAFYGTPSDEGFNKPYYHGSTNLTVKPGEATEVSVTATLANSMVDVKYTDAFKNYFSDYSVTLHSKGYGHHAIPAEVTDPLYLVPGDVEVTVSFTKQNGQSATIQPTNFTAEARHFYHLTFDVNNGQVGDAQLVITFDDTLQKEDVEVDLSDELLNMPAPEVEPKGFTSDVAIPALEGAVPAEASYSVYAAGGITAAVLTVESDDYTPSFGKEVDLANASPTLQTQLQNEGVSCLGLFKNPDKLATVNIAGLIGHLPAGNYRITLVVKDRLTRVNEPVVYNVQIEPLVINFVSAQYSPIGSTDGTITLGYNGDNLKRDIVVKGLNDNGIWVDCPVESVSASASAKRAYTRSSSFPVRNYDVDLTLPLTTRDVQIKIYHNGKEVCNGVIEKRMPEYTLSSNDFAKRTIIKVGGVSGSMLEYVTENLRLFAGGSEIPAQNVTRSNSTGEITVIGLKPSTEYHITSTLQKGSNPDMGAEFRFTTEAEAQPENAGMENWASIKHPKHTYFFVGADYYEFFANATATQSYWATRNPMTTYYEGQSTLSYTVFSGTQGTDSGFSGRAADIFTVGWGSGNTYAGGASIIKHRTPGMLFMGDYSYDGSEHFTFGRPFTSRPTSLSFVYKYAPINNESFRAYVVIENRSGSNVTELARAELVSGDAVSSFRETVLNLKYSNLSLKATHAYIVFESSTAQEPGTSAGSYNGNNVHIGSKLTIDNIQFNY